MGSNSRFSAQIALNKKLNYDNVQECFNLFLEKEFTAYDYEKNSYENFKSVLKKYPNDPRYSLKYKTVSFGISCSEGKDYLLLNMDNGEDSEIILTLINSLSKLLDTIFLFSYIDKEGDSPNNFDSNINKLELKWLFKYNYFGKAYIDKFGRDFFTNMPCIKQEFITEDIIRIDLCKDIFSPIDKSLMQEVSAYLNAFDVKVNFYNHKNFFID